MGLLDDARAALEVDTLRLGIPDRSSPAAAGTGPVDERRPGDPGRVGYRYAGTAHRCALAEAHAAFVRRHAACESEPVVAEAGRRGELPA